LRKFGSLSLDAKLLVVGVGVFAVGLGVMIIDAYMIGVNNPSFLKAGLVGIVVAVFGVCIMVLAYVGVSNPRAAYDRASEQNDGKYHGD